MVYPSIARTPRPRAGFRVYSASMSTSFSRERSERALRDICRAMRKGAAARLTAVVVVAATPLAASCTKGQSTTVALSSGGARPANAGASGTGVGSSGLPPPGSSSGGAQTSSSAIFPLSVASSRRYLQDAKGAPFPVLGDAGWEASHNTDLAGQRVYIADRVSRGFNSVLAITIDHKSTLNKPPKDFAGNLPFSKRLDGQAYTGSPNGTNSANGSSSQYGADPYKDVKAEAPDFTYPGAAYWTQLDAFISECAGQGVAVFLFPSYVGFGGGDEGWMHEMIANDATAGAGGFVGQRWANASKSKLWNYGAWLAQHYATAPNIVWVLGGDFGTGGSGTFSTVQAAAVNSLVAGMKSVAGQQSTLWTAHWARPSVGTDVAQFASLLDLQSVYVNTLANTQTRAGYASTPTKPAFEIEDYYEGNSAGGGEPNRRYQWWSFLGAIAGKFSGNEALWPFPSNWKSQLDSPGAKDMAKMNSFIRSIPWQTLVPSGLNGAKQIVTANGGVPGDTDYIACAASSSTVVCYVPPGWAQGSFTIDSTVLSAPYRARWFNPSSGAYTAESSNIPNAGTHAFTPAGNNGSSFSDWVLVLDLP